MTSEMYKPRNKVSWALSFVTGLGFVLMAIALAMGVIQGENADSNTIGLLFIVGVALFIGGLVAWFAMVQPHKHFDDINHPEYTGHHDEAEEE